MCAPGGRDWAPRVLYSQSLVLQGLLLVVSSVWVPETHRAGHATIRYSWMSPPRRSVRCSPLGSTSIEATGASSEAWATLSNLGTAGMAAEDGPWLGARSSLPGSSILPHGSSRATAYLTPLYYIKPSGRQRRLCRRLGQRRSIAQLHKGSLVITMSELESARP